MVRLTLRHFSELPSEATFESMLLTNPKIRGWKHLHNLGPHADPGMEPKIFPQGPLPQRPAKIFHSGSIAKHRVSRFLARSAMISQEENKAGHTVRLLLDSMVSRRGGTGFIPFPNPSAHSRSVDCSRNFENQHGSNGVDVHLATVHPLQFPGAARYTYLRRPQPHPIQDTAPFADN